MEFGDYNATSSTAETLTQNATDTDTFSDSSDNQVFSTGQLFACAVVLLIVIVNAGLCSLCCCYWRVYSRAVESADFATSPHVTLLPHSADDPRQNALREFVTTLCKKTWRMRVGHTARIGRVYHIHNDKLRARYNEAYRASLGRATVPQQLLNQPIKTGKFRIKSDNSRDVEAGPSSDAFQAGVLREGEAYLFYHPAPADVEATITSGMQPAYYVPQQSRVNELDPQELTTKPRENPCQARPTVVLTERSICNAGGKTDTPNPSIVIVARVALGKTGCETTDTVRCDTIVQELEGGGRKSSRRFLKSDTTQIYPEFIASVHMGESVICA